MISNVTSTFFQTHLRKMITLILLTFLPIIFLCFLQRKIWAAKTLVPPGPPGLPFIGNLHQFATATNIHVYLSKLSNKYGPLMHMRLGSVPVLIISSAKLAKEVMKTQDLSFCDRPKQLGSQKITYNGVDITFSPYSDHWKELRKIAAVHLFSPTKVQSFRPIREDEVHRLVDGIADLASRGKSVNLSEMAMAFGSSLICREAFGKRFDDGGARRFDELLHEAQALAVAFFVSDYFPWLGWVDKLSGLMRRLDKCFKELDSFYQELIDEHLDPAREKKGDDHQKEDDILDVMIKLREDKSCPIDLHWDCIKAMLVDILVAGTDTTAASIVWTMTAVMKAPSSMKRLQAEIRELLGQKPRVDEDDLENLPYLKAVINEAFRLYPPTPMLVPRVTREKCILEGYEIQPNTVVYVNAWAIARDPKYWDNPTQFLPERFLNTDIDIKGQDFRVIPFGSGRRICPGLVMGLINVELGVANLIHCFDWEFPLGIEARDVNTDALPGIAMHKKDPLLLVPKKFHA